MNNLISAYPGVTVPTKKNSNCNKILFLFLNVVLLICGLLTLAVGLYLRIMKAGYPISLLPNLNFYLSTTILAAPGVVILLATILGFCGASKYGRPYMIAFVISLSLLFLVQVGSVIAIVMYKPSIVAMIEDVVMAGIGQSARMKTWDDVQRSIKCCGVHNYTNWQGFLASANPLAVPDSCCKAHLYNYPGCGEAGGYRAYERGCLNMIITWIKEHFKMVAGGGIGFGLVQVILLSLGVAIACCHQPATKNYLTHHRTVGMHPGLMMPQNSFGMSGLQIPEYPPQMSDWTANMM